MTTVPVLLTGVPRSGTSWVGRILGSTPGAAYLNEPDNHGHNPFALKAKLGLPGRFYPELSRDDAAPLYARLWAVALGEGGDRDSAAERIRREIAARLLQRATDDDVRRSFEVGRPLTSGLRAAARLAVPERRPDGRRLVVKTVHAQLALEWIAARFPVKVVVVIREPLNVLSSWKEMGWLDSRTGVLSELGPDTVGRLEARFTAAAGGTANVEQAARLIGLLHSALVDAARLHPDWLVLSHETLCVRPHDAFSEAAATLGLDWGPTVDELLEDLNRPGTGYETTRVASELADAWRSRLAPAELDAAQSVFERFAGLDVR